MAMLIEEGEASEEVLAVYADIKATRKTDWVNNFWKALANHPATLKRIWENIKQVMAPGALDSLQGIGLHSGQRHEQLRLLHSVPHRCGARQGDDGEAIGGIVCRHRSCERKQPFSDRIWRPGGRKISVCRRAWLTIFPKPHVWRRARA